MSTKWLLIGGDEFQLYQELFDDGFIYLELSQTHFEANPRSVQVRIPIEIWETIRHHGGPDLSLLQKSDEEIRALVEQAVDARIRAHNEG